MREYDWKGKSRLADVEELLVGRSAGREASTGVDEFEAEELLLSAVSLVSVTVDDRCLDLGMSCACC